MILSALRASLLSAMVSRDVCVVERRVGLCHRGYAVALGQVGSGGGLLTWALGMRAARLRHEHVCFLPFVRHFSHKGSLLPTRRASH